MVLEWVQLLCMIMSSMVDDVASFCLVKECKGLEVLGLSSQIRY